MSPSQSPTPAAPRPIEIELKYRLREEAAGDRYLLSDDLGGFRPISPVRSTQLEDRYLDTADGALARAGFAARLRQTAKGTTVSVKSIARRGNGVHGATHRREELEGPADRTAGPQYWPHSDARSLILEQCGDAPLVELVTIRQLRRKRKLQFEDTVVEVSLDEVDAVARSRVVERFVELEVELVRGDEAALARIADVADADAKLTISTGSKLESALAALKATSGKKAKRGLVLPEAEDGGDGATEPPPQPEAATREAESEPAPESAAAAVTVEEVSSPDVHPPAPEATPRLPVPKTPGVLLDDHVAEAGRKVLRFHLARMLAKEAGTRDGSDPEELHDMRVATRRQRAAWRVFGSAFRGGRTRTYRRGLRDIASRLGAVRDLDVLLDAADDYRDGLPTAEQRALEPLLTGWRAHRADARRLLIRELDSDAYKRWLDDYSEFVRHDGLAVVPVSPTQPHRVRDTAGSQILAAYEGVRAYEPVLRWADVETLHELRIAGKWLRYTLEFSREALPADASMLIARVTALQDHLGLLNDANVTAGMARSFLVENAGGLSSLESAAIGRYLVSREREVARLRRTVGGPWRGVAGVSFRRALGRTIAGL
ncbi:MAG TPA: CHAD domain-containing protein [Candidatus Limnocylindrales bacterium]|nr:CHAD domain-containing protein [Candidatus Limnocylindrales bacterium]